MAKKRKAVKARASKLVPNFDVGMHVVSESIMIDNSGKLWWLSPQTGCIRPALIEDWPKK